MQLAEKIIVVESSAIAAGEESSHIELIAGEPPAVIFHLGLEQARSLAISLVEKVHRLEVANSMRKAKQKPARSAQDEMKGAIGRASMNIVSLIAR